MVCLLKRHGQRRCAENWQPRRSSHQRLPTPSGGWVSPRPHNVGVKARTAELGRNPDVDGYRQPSGGRDLRRARRNLDSDEVGQQLAVVAVDAAVLPRVRELVRDSGVHVGHAVRGSHVRLLRRRCLSSLPGSQKVERERCVRARALGRSQAAMTTALLLMATVVFVAH